MTPKCFTSFCPMSQDANAIYYARSCLNDVLICIYLIGKSIEALQLSSFFHSFSMDFHDSTEVYIKK